MKQYTNYFFQAILVVFACTSIAAQSNPEPVPNLKGRLGQPLRYTPEGTDFVIVNGKEYFNRPLYGGNTAFRVDAGDLPEFVLYLPGRGGNLRLGIRNDQQVYWLHELDYIKAVYRSGSMIYEIMDSEILGEKGKLVLTAIATRDIEGLVIKIETSELPKSFQLLWAYGGINGQRGKRDGDIGTEDIPISEWFQLQPSFTEGNIYQVKDSSFILSSKAGLVFGTFPRGSGLSLKDANDWNDKESLFLEKNNKVSSEFPVIIGYTPLRAGNIYHIGLQYIPTKNKAAIEGDAKKTGSDYIPDSSMANIFMARNELPGIFKKAEEQRGSISGKIQVITPDPYLNAAATALCTAADAVWDEPTGTVMHGAIAWRSRLLGWRGPYSMDALGWHSRARSHFEYWSTRQNFGDIPKSHAPPEEKTNLARMRSALHTNGDIANSHYDMNLVYIDALFRHFMWTGDLVFAKKMWPTIERHLAWERRSFRREYGPEKLPLYEAYAAIWASDDLQYHGSGVAYTSAYNYWHNVQAARLAGLLGYDGSFYENEARLIARAMREVLWMPEAGMFAEYKDKLGNQLLHTEPGLWTFYHILDAGLPTKEEAFAMTHWVDAHIPHIPVYGEGLPDNSARYVLSTTNWMPYTWSVNNVTMNENMHAALAFWQAGRPEEAWRITKSSILASMFMGICPGNIGSMNYLDVYRRESQRDFADGSGVFSRALVEGLFGVRPDLLSGVLTFAPGLPYDWDHASLKHTDIDIEFSRKSNKDYYSISSRLPVKVRLKAYLPALYAKARVLVNGQTVPSNINVDAIVPELIFDVPASDIWEISIKWSGKKIERAHPVIKQHSEGVGFVPGISGFDWSKPRTAESKIETVDLTNVFNDRLTEIFKLGKYRSPRSPGVSLSIPAQGIGSWAGHVHAMAEINDSGLRALGGSLELPNGIRFDTPEGKGDKNVVFVSQWDNYPNEISVPLKGKSKRVFLLMAGSTNHMQSHLENAVVIINYSDGSETKLPLVNPTNWWPIDQDYFIDDYQFCRPGPLPPRVDLKTGNVRFPDRENFIGTGQKVEGGAATLLTLPLDDTRSLKRMQIKACANEVIIGLLSVTLER